MGRTQCYTTILGRGEDAMNDAWGKLHGVHPKTLMQGQISRAKPQYNTTLNWVGEISKGIHKIIPTFKGKHT